MAFQIFLERALDANGDPLSGALAYIYETGTTTPETTYSDTALSAANTNPIVADSAGRFGQAFYDGNVDVKVVYRTSAGVEIETRDPAPTTFAGDFTVDGTVTFSGPVVFTPALGSQPIIKNTYPNLRFWDTDGTTTHNRGSVDFADNAFQVMLEDNAGTDVDQLYIIDYGASGGVSHKLRVGSVDQLHVEANLIRPGNDNATDLGSGTFRLDDVFATNATIQTSDAREKQDIAELTEAERLVALRLRYLVRTFRWKKSVEEKGDDARIHCGVIVQDVIAAFEAEGLDPYRYAMVIGHPDSGEPMGVRYSELLAFIIGAL